MSSNALPASPNRKVPQPSRHLIRSMVIRLGNSQPPPYKRRRVKSEPIIPSWDFRLPKERHTVSKDLTKSSRASKAQRRSDLIQTLSMASFQMPLDTSLSASRARTRRGSKRKDKEAKRLSKEAGIPKALSAELNLSPQRSHGDDSSNETEVSTVKRPKRPQNSDSESSKRKHGETPKKKHTKSRSGDFLDAEKKSTEDSLKKKSLGAPEIKKLEQPGSASSGSQDRSRSNSIDIAIDSPKEKVTSSSGRAKKVPIIQAEQKLEPTTKQEAPSFAEEENINRVKKSASSRLGDYFRKKHKDLHPREESPTTFKTPKTYFDANVQDHTPTQTGRRHLSRNKSVSGLSSHFVSNPEPPVRPERSLKRANTLDSSLKSAPVRVRRPIQGTFLTGYLLSIPEQELLTITISDLLKAFIKGLHQETIEETELAPIVLVWPEWAPLEKLLEQAIELYDEPWLEPFYRGRLIQFLCVWVDEVPSDFENPVVYSLLKAFIDRLQSEKDVTQVRFGTLLFKTISESLQSLSEEGVFTVPFCRNQYYHWLYLPQYGWPCSQHSIKLTSKGSYEAVVSSSLMAFKGPVSRLGVLDFDMEELAKQMTLYTHRLFSQIPRLEFFNNRFLEPENSPNLNKFGEWFNTITLWVGGEITTTFNTKRRIKIIAQFIQLAKFLRKAQNFHGFFATVSGLSQFSVSRLKQTWKMVPQPTTNIFYSHTNTLSPSSNFKNLRSLHDHCEPPCVPASLILIRDLVSISEGNKNINESEAINFQKFQLLGKYMKRIQDTQHCFYSYSPVSIHQSYIQHIAQNPPCLQELEALSLKIEPRHSVL